MQTLTQIREILARFSARPMHRFGQNFMIDLNTMKKIVDAAHIPASATVLEVGPGTGSLTEELVARANKVVAAEIDRNLSAHLRDHFADAPSFSLIEGDALAGKHALAPAILEAVAPRCHLVANLPYNIATPLIAEMLNESHQSLSRPGVCFERMTFIVQKEVARRMGATVDNPSDYGMVSILIGILADVKLGKVIPPGAFYPPPKIDSQIVRIDFNPIKAERLKSLETLQALLRQCFTQRRKNVLTTAKSRAAAFDKPTLAAALDAANVPHDRRADALSPDEFLAVVNALSEQPSLEQ
ncbi:MAG: ribosomal RNA small subunit methyltransferase A [Phycisphaerales bacterium]|jgi:16S rRNA (adenine1518-N6/adenine1519-N6)-dimethyltransferase|nr:ribosomal RNA small subunit methyltransferase A [Phycisphaerales bacterium]MBT7170478.1 ribosomal RNA small subunit methyltransferase A [Phycisphaerales bacterium]